jgi:hypothetical protein
LTADAPPSKAKLVIPPPRADRPPLHANLLNRMQQGCTALTPLFPYMHPGAMVPAGSVFIGGPDQDYGQFYHHNTVDEIIIAFVSKGGALETGQLYTGGRVHGVNSFLKDQTAPGTFALFTITQRQLEVGEQPEHITVLCKQCRKEIFRGNFDGTSPPDAREIDHPFQGAAAVPPLFREFNEDPEQRRCPDCGHVNQAFPVHAWGWDTYATQSKVMADAKQLLLEAGPKAPQ